MSEIKNEPTRFIAIGHGDNFAQIGTILLATRILPNRFQRFWLRIIGIEFVTDKERQALLAEGRPMIPFREEE